MTAHAPVGVPRGVTSVLRRVLVVGYGSIGARHARIVRALRQDAVIGVLRSTSGSMAVEQEGLVAIPNLDAAIAFTPSAAVIASPATYHAATAVALIEAGIPVLIEKPLAAEVADARAIVAAAARRGVPVATGYNLRFAPGLAWIRERVRAGVIGPVRVARAEVGQYLPAWRPGQDYRLGVSARRDLGGGALLELSHELDYITWLLGAPQAVVAMVSRTSDLELDVEDCAQVLLSFTSSDGRPVSASVTLDLVRRDPRRRCTLVGRDGTLEWDGVTGLASHFDAASGHTQAYESPRGDRDSTYRAEWLDFAEAIVSGQPPLVDAQSGLRVVELVDAARIAASEGRVVALGVEGAPGAVVW